MNNDIQIENIFGTNDVSHRTPILVLKNVGLQYLVIVNKLKPLVYSVNTTLLYKKLERYIKFIYQFAPIHQIDGTPDKSEFTVLLANMEYFDMSGSVIVLNKSINLMIGIHKNGEKNGRTLGAVYPESAQGVEITYPIFPKSMMFSIEFKKSNTTDNDNLEEYVLLDKYSNSEGNEEIYNDVYYAPNTGRWGLKQRFFDISGKHFRMVNPAGDVSNLYIPKYVSPRNITTSYDDLNNEYERKIYFDTQGEIATDKNCVVPADNTSKIFINECNATDTQINKLVESYDAEVMAYGFTTDTTDGFTKYAPKKRSSKRKKIIHVGSSIVLREKDEPWFMDRNIVGDIADREDVYKITGIIENNTSSEKKIAHTTYEKPPKLIDTCKKSKVIENFDDNESNNVNNIIMYILCILLVVLLFFKRYE